MSAGPQGCLPQPQTHSSSALEVADTGPSAKVFCRMKRPTTHQGAHVAHYLSNDLGSWERGVTTADEFSCLIVFAWTPLLAGVTLLYQGDISILTHIY